MTRGRYRGRFAPSPTGPLHFGSLVSALASYLEARTHNGEWHVRIDDLDQTRCIPGMDATILHALENFGFEWHGPIIYQSESTDAYQAALTELQSHGHTYACQCSRSQIKAIAKPGIEGPIYPDTCRKLALPQNSDLAIRVLTDDAPILFNDGVYGQQSQCLHSAIGDFVIRRADGFFAYQLAVVVDDQLAGVTHVVRGADLLTSTPRQIYLQKLLKYPHPDYLHVPLVRDSLGRKLSKSDDAHPVDPGHPVSALLDAWHFLGQTDEPKDCALSLPVFWEWAINHWNSRNIVAEIEQPHE